MDTTARLPLILLIEADPNTAALYRRELSHDYTVVTSADEAQVWEILLTDQLKAIVLEPIGLGKWGWDLLAAIKSKPAMQAIPVVVCSTLDERRKGLEMGAAYFLVKPVLPSTLLQVLHKVT
jgi:DNA-binding response OmpR family regulator